MLAQLGSPERAKLSHASCICVANFSAAAPVPENDDIPFKWLVPNTKPSSSAWQEPSAPPIAGDFHENR
jgi:hypothetical protein